MSTPVRKSAAIEASDPAATYPSFLGCGWSFPPTFDRRAASVSMVSGDTDIRESLWIILSTSLGERIMLPSFGCDLISKVFTVLTTTSANELSSMVANAILEWEPRVTVQNISTATRADAPGSLIISIDYVVRQTNSRANLVYRYYLNESTLPPPPS